MLVSIRTTWPLTGISPRERGKLEREWKYIKMISNYNGRPNIFREKKVFIDFEL